MERSDVRTHLYIMGRWENEEKAQLAINIPHSQKHKYQNTISKKKCSEIWKCFRENKRFDLFIKNYPHP